jgi:predicted O-linked N-acetylglucosamine transferase (SPINDLY family)
MPAPFFMSKKKQKKSSSAKISFFDQAFQHHRCGRLDEAVKCYLLALNEQPDNANAYSNLSDALSKLGMQEQAQACCQQAIALQPDLAHAHANLGNSLKAQGKFEQARLAYLAALRIKPDWAEVYNNLAQTLRDLGFLADAADCLRKALALVPDWPSAHDSLLFCLSHDVQVEPQQLFAAHQDFARQFELPLRASLPKHANSKDPQRRLNIGFVSGDLHHLALAGYFEPLFKGLACKPGLCLSAYYTNIIDDSVTQRLKSCFVHWHPVAGLSAAELADKVRADSIDILIDLSGHTTHNRLLSFARKPAPVQASWLGYLGSTGLQAMDYYICDRYWIPPGELDWQFSEKPAYLPAAVVFEPNDFAPPVSALPALKNGYLTFGSFNRTNKINASVLMLWAMLLRSLPTARMLLGAIPEESQAGIVESFAAAGIDPGRLEFQPRLVMLGYLTSHARVDVCLDTFPFGGGVTTLHAAWMGVPTLSLAGETPASRFGAAEMHILGLDDFVANSIEDFIDKGRYWAGQVAELAALRTAMRARFAASPMGQAQNFADSFERFLRSAWQGWCAGLPVCAIDVQADGETKTVAAGQNVDLH